MHYYSYIVFLSIALHSVLMRKRTPDLFTITIVASAYYSSTLLFGEVYDPDNHIYREIDSLIYAFYCFFFLLLSACVHFYDRMRVVNDDSRWRKRDLSRFCLFVLFAVFLLINLLDSRAFFPEQIGATSAASFGFLFSAYWCVAIVYASVAMETRSRFHIIFSLFFLITTLLAGSRAILTAGLMAMFVVYHRQLRPLTIIKSKGRVFLGIAGFAFLIIFKNVYQYLLLLDFNQLIETFANWDLIVFRLTKGGESVILLNFIHAIEMRSVEPGGFLELVFLKSFPFISDQMATAFGLSLDTLSDKLNETYYSTVNYGMASSIWGLLYLTGGGFGLYFGALVFCLAILICQYYISAGRLMGVFLIPGSVFMAFYSSRLEIGAILYPLYLGFTLYIFYLCAIQFLRATRRSYVTK